MTAVRSRKHARPEPPQQSAVYDGSDLLGVIKPIADAFVVCDANGKRLGAFDDPTAMRAVTAHARGVNEEAANEAAAHH